MKNFFNVITKCFNVYFCKSWMLFTFMIHIFIEMWWLWSFRPFPIKKFINALQIFTYGVTTLTLGLRPRYGLTKLADQKWNLGVTFHVPGNAGKCEGMNPTLLNEFPLWELESQWTPKLIEGNCRGQNSLDWKILYTIEKILEHKCLKWAHVTHLST
jgi:hypothetical protein